MPRHRILDILLIFLVVTGIASAAHGWEMISGQRVEAYVQGLDPGNNLIVNERNRDNEKNFSISFYGIGIPTRAQPFGKEAHELLAQILPKGQKVFLTLVKKNEEGIFSALVQLNDHSINNMLVDKGLAWVDRSTCKAFFCRRWHIQEHLAVKDRRGVWSLNMSTPPWQWGEVKDSSEINRSLYGYGSGN